MEIAFVLSPKKEIGLGEGSEEETFIEDIVIPSGEKQKTMDHHGWRGSRK